MSNESRTFRDAGGIRGMAARWVIIGQMTLKTATHLGGEAGGFVDMAVLRDTKDGRPLLPGTSLAGALRGHLADVLGGYRSKEHRDVPVFFGAARSDDEGSQSPLIVFDSLGVTPASQPVEIRDGVAIDPATGTAETHKKFDFELLPAGTLFPVRLELVVPDAASEPKLLGCLAITLEGLQEGEISLGMRRSRGMGAAQTRKWRALRYDLTTPEGWLGWLTADHESPIPDDATAHESPRQAIQAAYPGLAFPSTKDQRERIVIDLALQLAGDLLVRSPAGDPTAPDVVHLHSAGKPVLPGTSIAGALRAQALKIARLVRASWGDGDEWIKQLFGPRFEKNRSSDSQEANASRLRISESFVESGVARRQARIAIDRFTGGVVQGALFDEEVQSGGDLSLRLELRKPSEPEIGLLLLVLKDLLSGDIPVGGAAAVGRGILKGEGRIRMADGTKHDIAADLRISEETKSFFNSLIQAFHEAPLKSEVKA